MNIFTDMYYINKKSIKEAAFLMVKNWPIIFTGFVYATISLILGFVYMFFSGSFVLTIVMGILLFIASVAMTSSYLYLLHNIVKYQKFTFKDFKDGFTAYLRKIWTIFFIGWVVELLYSNLLAPILVGITGGAIGYGILGLILSLLILVLFNPLPETIYQKHYAPVDSIKYAFDFVKENWIEWFIPNIILFGVLYLSTGILVMNMFTYNIGFSFNISLSSILLYLIGQIIFSFTMVYRGILFEILSTSTRRKRMFMRNMYK